MEVFDYIERREVRLEDVFSGDKNKGRHDDVTHLFKKFSITLDKKIRAWWDIVSFEQYLAHNMVPRRLRWEVPPNDGLEDEESMQDWYLFFNKKGIELMEFLLSRKRKKLLIVESTIRELKKKMEKIDKETQEKKRKKFSNEL